MWIKLNLFFLVFGMSFLCNARPTKIVFVADITTNKLVWKEVLNGATLAIQKIKQIDGEVTFTKLNSGTTVFGTKKAMESLEKEQVDVVIAEIDSSKAEVAA